MRNPDRIPEIIQAIFAIWQENPDLRLGQMIVNAAKASDSKTNDIFYVEDDVILAGLIQMAQGDVG